MSVKKWDLSNRKVLSNTSVFDLVALEAHSPRNNKKCTFYRIECQDWVSVLPITGDGNVLLVRQFRAGIEEVNLELPGGIIEVGESPQQAALRELEEETGYTTTPNKLQSLGFVWPNPAIQNNRCYLFVAEQIEALGDVHFDEAEDIENVIIPYDEFLNKIAKHEMNHAIVLDTTLRYELLRRNLLRP